MSNTLLSPSDENRTIYPDCLLDQFTGLPIASIEHSGINLGDEIQTIAADQFVSDVRRRYDREKLRQVRPDKRYAMIVNGWFAHDPAASFPPHPRIKPVIVGMHIQEGARDYFRTPRVLNYLRKHAPIGCRDKATCELLTEHGVDAYVSGCLTLTLPKRMAPPKDPLVAIVDMPRYPKWLIPSRLRTNAVYLSHLSNAKGDERQRQARELLDFYRDRVGLVITTRLHCALPCAAMGIPVVLFGDKEPDRMSAAEMAGLKVHRMRTFSKHMNAKGGPVQKWLRRILIQLDSALIRLKYRFFDPIDWNPEPVEIEDLKHAMRNDLYAQFERLGERIPVKPVNLESAPL